MSTPTENTPTVTAVPAVDPYPTVAPISPAPDPVAQLRNELSAGLESVRTTVESLKTTVTDLQRTLRFVYGAAMIVVGAVGGPSAVTAILGK